MPGWWPCPCPPSCAGRPSTTCGPRPSTLPDLDGKPPSARRVAGGEEAAGHLLQLVRMPLRPPRLAGPSRRAALRRASPSSPWPSTKRPTMSGRGPRASPCPCSTTPTISSPSCTPSPTCPPWCGSTRMNRHRAAQRQRLRQRPVRRLHRGERPVPTSTSVRRWVRDGDRAGHRRRGPPGGGRSLRRRGAGPAALPGGRRGPPAGRPRGDPATRGHRFRAGPRRPDHLAGGHAPDRRGPVRRRLPGPVRGVEAAGHALPRPVAGSGGPSRRPERQCSRRALACVRLRWVR